ncbi:hypothetical protein [Inquilinus sp. OTU3971]|uniref:hypothetical protein n=1 Tax=Inquilinus sp. OTU3971 TaxID=3043855 RepID=UPI00313F2214
MSGLVRALIARDRPVPPAAWHDLWDRLQAGSVAPVEAASILSSLSTGLPDHATIVALLGSLAERRPGPKPVLPAGTVNIVGTGGGPATFNISTAAAFVAAAIGVRVVKTGSRAYSSRCGSIDLLERLQIPLAGSPAQLEDLLDRFGVAFAGGFVYPAELTLLARAVVPLEMKVVGRFFNVVGPFLADMPVAAQITGVSNPAVLPALKHLASRETRRIWLCRNDLGIDELVSFDINVITPNDASQMSVGPLRQGIAVTGSPDDLAPAGDGTAVVDHFLGILSGEGPAAAIQTVSLNAAALALIAGNAVDWAEAIEMARLAIRDGHARALADTIRAFGRKRAPQLLPMGASHG